MVTNSGSESFDVVVIGGGPGGAMVGTILAMNGKRVLILERELFPRYHIGESLLSGTADLLKRIDVLDQMDRAGYIRKYGVEWVWGKNREPWTVYFKDALAMPYDWGYQVERGPFDKMLLDNAAEKGATVRQQCRVVDVTFDASGHATIEYEDLAAGGTKRVEARWTIDASGQGGFVTKKLRKQEWDPYLKNMAVWSYWKGARRGAGIDSGNTFLPTFAEGWWWFIPLRDDVTSIGAVLDRDSYKRVKEGKVPLEEFYRDAIKRTPELAERLQSATMVDEIRVLRDWSYVYDRFAGTGFAAVGDAACFIDPLFSTGVHLAMLSGYLCAITVNTILDNRGFEAQALLDFYDREYRKEFNRLKSQVYFLYGGHADSKENYFWNARNQFDVPGLKPERAFISLIAGAYEHRSWYRRYIDHLKVPGHLQSMVGNIFEGRAAGADSTGLDEALVSTKNWSIESDFAIKGSYLEPSKTLRLSGGGSLPITDQLEGLLKKVDGKRSGSELIESAVRDGLGNSERLVQVLHEAITYGVLTRAGSSVGVSASAE